MSWRIYLAVPMSMALNGMMTLALCGGEYRPAWLWSGVAITGAVNLAFCRWMRR
jgi:hypothetical protein